MGQRLYQHKDGHIASKEQRSKGENFINAYPILAKRINIIWQRQVFRQPQKGTLLQMAATVHQVLCIIAETDFKTNIEQVLICKVEIMIASTSKAYMRIKLIRKKCLEQCLADDKHSVGISYYYLRPKITFSPILYSIRNIPLILGFAGTYIIPEGSNLEVNSRILVKIEFHS